MTDQEGDRGLEGFRGVWKNGLSPEAKPSVTGLFSRPPLVIISHYLFYYIPP